jgi:hypothetical protein
VFFLPQVDVQDVIRMSQAEGEPEHPLSQAISKTLVQRASQAEDDMEIPEIPDLPDLPDAPTRWAKQPRDIKIIANANTAKADKKCMAAFTTYLKEVHNIQELPQTMEQVQLKKLLAQYITQASHSTWQTVASAGWMPWKCCLPACPGQDALLLSQANLLAASCCNSTPSAMFLFACTCR